MQVIYATKPIQFNTAEQTTAKLGRSSKHEVDRPRLADLTIV